jgi:oligoribonuclease
MSLRSDLLVWIDLEMTGLDPHENKIIEIASIITDSELSIIAEGPNIIISQPEEELVKMDEWNVSHHTSNGLIDKVRKSSIDTKAAEQITCEFLAKYCTPNTALLCGNSIGTDRLFLFFHMQELEKFVHYRSIDVTSVKELTRRWYPKGKKYRKNSGHRALDDIRGSIEELKLYREHFFRE